MVTEQSPSKDPPAKESLASEPPPDLAFEPTSGIQQNSNTVIQQEVHRPPSIRSSGPIRHLLAFSGMPRPASAPGYDTRSSERTKRLVYNDEKHAASQAEVGKVERKEQDEDDEFDEELDILEFRLHNDMGIMRAVDDPNAAPQVIRYSKNRGLSTSAEDGRLSAQIERSDYMSNASSHSLDSTSRQSLAIDRDSSHARKESVKSLKASDFSHQAMLESEQPSELLSGQMPDEDNNSDNEWQDMKTVGSYDIYDDKGRVVVHKNLQDADLGEENGQVSAAKGYTRLAGDDDAKSVTSIDENTAYLFDDDDDLSRNPVAQLQMTKELLTDSQRIAYVGLCRLVMNEMAKKIGLIKPNRKTASGLSKTQGSIAMWTQRIMNRLYLHMDLSAEGGYDKGLQFAFLTRTNHDRTTFSTWCSP
jgi:hypothetical protein